MSSRIEQIIEEIEEYIDSCKFQPLSTTKIIVNGVMQRGSLYICQKSLYWIILWNICRILIIWEWMTGELNLTYIFHS
mgnify:CR=1 FL=1